MSKGSKLRRQASQLDVTNRAYYALQAGAFDNPYGVADPRYGMFSVTLARVQSMDAEAKHMFEAYGVDEASMPRVHRDPPGPVQDVEILVETLRLQRERGAIQ